MPYRLLFQFPDIAPLLAGTAMTVTGPVIASEAPIPGVEYLTPFGLLMVVLWAVGAMIRKLQADSSSQTATYIQNLAEQNAANAKRADEVTRQAAEASERRAQQQIALTERVTECMVAVEAAVDSHQKQTDEAMHQLKATVQDMQKVVVEAGKMSTEVGIAMNRQLAHWAEIIEQWQKNFPCVAMQSAEGRQMLARKVKEKEAE